MHNSRRLYQGQSARRTYQGQSANDLNRQYTATSCGVPSSTGQSTGRTYQGQSANDLNRQRSSGPCLNLSNVGRYQGQAFNLNTSNKDFSAAQPKKNTTVHKVSRTTQPKKNTTVHKVSRTTQPKKNTTVHTIYHTVQPRKTTVYRTRVINEPVITSSTSDIYISSDLCADLLIKGAHLVLKCVRFAAKTIFKIVKLPFVLLKKLGRKIKHKFTDADREPVNISRESGFNRTYQGSIRTQAQ